MGTDGAYSDGNVYYWNNFSDTNKWSTSNLNTRNLNTNYITYLNNINSKWTNIIAQTTWKVGGNTSTNISNSAMYIAYQNEIVSPRDSTTYSAKIGLMYVSDYGYAASPTYWTYAGYSSSSSNKNDYSLAINANWMYSGVNEWTITRDSVYDNRAFFVYHKGYITSNSSLALKVRPCFYLNSNVTYTGVGDGSSESPYRIK